MSASVPNAESVAPRRRVYQPAIGPRLKLLLNGIFCLLAVLGANSLYLAGITVLEWSRQETYQNQFYMLMFLAHLVLGALILVPFLIFGTIHLATARKRKNRRAVRVGYALFGVCLGVLITGVLLVRLGGFELKDPSSRNLAYWLHVGLPLAGGWLYWLHRLVGQKIRWKLGVSYAAIVVVVVGVMISLHSTDPRAWNQVGPEDGVKYFEPSLARTTNGSFIPAKVLDNDEYCLSCHKDAYEGWFHSAHHLSSFNNPAYLATIRETRAVMLERDGHVKNSRWCAGCHDPVPFFSGAFDDPKFDDVAHPTAQAGITCTTCHAITHVNSNRGNADYTIEEPLHYPFAFSENPWLQWVNHQLIKAKPAFHKKTFLKDFHSSAEFCSTCHKVHLPQEVTHYKEFLRGQNHYDSWLLSGVSGHGSQSFYFPEKAASDCQTCHMLPQASEDFAAKPLLEDDPRPMIHNHQFASGNMGVLALAGHPPEAFEPHREFLEDVLRVDLFGIKSGGEIDGDLTAPLRPQVPELKPGETYLLETVVRTLKLGHHFTQGTADSNEVWLDVTLRSGDKVIGRSGGRSDRGEVDRWSHFVNVFMLDRNGDRISRRNAQDIFVPLYNHQIPPGAGQVVHYRFTLPEELKEPVTVDVKVQYRKFDREYLDFIAKTTGNQRTNSVPIFTLAEDSLTFPVAGGALQSSVAPSTIPAWQRWNDYGIGLLLEGKAELKQAEAAFREVESLGRYDGPLNLARVLYREGRISEAGAAIRRAARHKDPAPPEWTLAWLSGLVNREELHLVEAEENFRQVLYGASSARTARGFDFSRDYRVINLLGLTLFDRALQIRSETSANRRDKLLRAAAAEFHKTLAIDSENVAAHYNLGQIYERLGEKTLADTHQRLHRKYKVDDTARSRAIRLARRKYPAGNHASEPPVIYDLQRSGAPELPAAAIPIPSQNESPR